MRIYYSIVVLSIIWIVNTNFLQAQFSEQLTQPMFNRYHVNPAFGGMERSLSITSGLRTQWQELDGAPNTQFINAHLPLYFINGAMGLSVINDIIGPTKRLDITGSYNYIMESKVGLISLGVQVGAYQYDIDYHELRTPDGSYIDGQIDHRDPTLQNGDLRSIAPIWGLGAYVVRPEMELGLSYQHRMTDISTGNPNKAIGVWHFNAVYSIVLSDQLMMQPQAYVKTDGVQWQTDIGALARYGQLAGGMTLRGYHSNSIDALNIIGAAQFNEYIRVSYSYDIGLTTIRQLHQGTHEIIINYNLNKKIKTGELPPIIYNPRYN